MWVERTMVGGRGSWSQALFAQPPPPSLSSSRLASCTSPSALSRLAWCGQPATMDDAIRAHGCDSAQSRMSSYTDAGFRCGQLEKLYDLAAAPARCELPEQAKPLLPLLAFSAIARQCVTRLVEDEQVSLIRSPPRSDSRAARRRSRC